MTRRDQLLRRAVRAQFRLKRDTREPSRTRFPHWSVQRFDRTVEAYFGLFNAREALKRLVDREVEAIKTVLKAIS